MGSRRTFIRKLIYMAFIGLLLIPLYWLGHPATNAAKGEKPNPGGVLAQLRDKYKLSQAQLGEIDPGSVTIKLATLGLRGVAANILWEKATDYKMKKDWTNFGGTLNQITKVQPNFLNVWTNQAWNLSYNISVEFDDYRERYRWVVKGFKFLNEGIKYNEGQPRLVWDMGRMVSQKIGKADEVKQYRRLFAKDIDYRESLPVDLRDVGLDYKGQPDNWLVGKGWYEKAVNIAHEYPKRGVGQSPLIYESSAPMCQMNYADAMEKDGVFGEVAKGAWANASKDWFDYGNREIATSFRKKDSEEPIGIRLNEAEMHQKAAAEGIAKLEKMQPGLRDKIVAEKRKALTADQRQALDTPPEKRTPKQGELAMQADQSLQVTHDDVARRVGSAGSQQRETAKKLAKEIAEHEQFVAWIHGNRNIVNFEYWRQHAADEQESGVLEARQLIYKGDRAFVDGDLVAADAAYKKGLDAWRKALDKHPEYVADQTSCEDLVEVIKRYRRVLSQRDERFPEPFILQDVIDSYQRQTGGVVPQPAPKDGKKPESRQPAAEKPEVKKTDVKKPEAQKPDAKKAAVKKPDGK
jgi:hypothetical protein